MLALIEGSSVVRGAWALYVLAKLWPGEGEVVMLGGGDAVASWVEAGCRAGGKGSVVRTTELSVVSRMVRMLVVGEELSEGEARNRIEYWIERVPVHGLMAIRRALAGDLEGFSSRVVGRGKWRMLLRQEGVMVLERVGGA